MEVLENVDKSKYKKQNTTIEQYNSIKNRVKTVSSLKNEVNNKPGNIKSELVYNYCYMCTSNENISNDDRCNSEYPYDPYCPITGIKQNNNEMIINRENKTNKGFFSRMFNNFRCGVD